MGAGHLCGPGLTVPTAKTISGTNKSPPTTWHSDQIFLDARNIFTHTIKYILPCRAPRCWSLRPCPCRRVRRPPWGTPSPWRRYACQGWTNQRWVLLSVDQWEVTWPGPPWRQLITPRTRPPLLASVLAIVTPHSNIAVVLLSTIYNIYYIYYLLRTQELEQEHLQQIRYLNSLILRPNRISSSFTDGETQTSHHQTFWLRCSPILIHYLVRYQILYTLLGTLSTPSRNREGAKYM